MEKVRKSNFELLRIISMILIVCHHYTEHGGVDFTSPIIIINKCFLQVMRYGGKMGVNLFILISAYFLIDSSFKVKKILKIWIQVSFYSVSIMVIYVIMGNKLNGTSIIKSIFPIIYNEYWFATTYFIMYILSKYLNFFIKKLQKKELQKLILILVTITSIIPTFTSGYMENSNLLWFVVLYMIASYIKLYYKDKFTWKKSLIIGSSIYGACLIFCCIMNFIGTKIPKIGSYDTYFMGMEKLPILCASIFIFLGFKGMNIKTNKFINFISASTFGVYLIHDNKIVRTLLWKKWLKNSSMANSNLLIIHAIFSVIIVYIVCTIIDILYKMCLEKRIMNICSKLYEKLVNKKEKRE